jgi:hypothetical protein
MRLPARSGDHLRGDEFGKLAKAANTLVVPANLADLASMIALATNVAKAKPGNRAA